jgi:hypothetical protein
MALRRLAAGSRYVARSGMTSQTLQAALRYAERRWHVFPCEARGKRPITRNGLKDATTNPEQIERLWRADGNANVAIRTGRESGIVVIDLDGDEGSDSLYLLEREHQDLPRTARVVTPRGGQHLYFRYPGVEVRNSAGRLGERIDVRGDGGYVLAPPSTGENGRRYEPDERAPLAELPAWLLERLSSAPSASQPAPTSEWIAIVRDGLRQGERNNGLARLTGHLLARDIDVHLVHELVLLVNRGCKPPLDEAEVDRVVVSIAGRELRKRKGARS